MGPRILLLQAREPGDPMKEHEHECFARRTGLPRASIVCHNLYDGAPTMAQLGAFDALMAGGSGDFYVSQGNVPEFDAFLEFLRGVVDTAHPTFASCFGYQAIVRALGGEVLPDESNREVGTYEMTLSAAGRSDPLFGVLPERFNAQLGHLERVTRPANGVSNLVSSDRCAHQALRVPGKPIWATQFHPELDREANTVRFRRYMEAYGTERDKQDLETALGRFRDSPETCRLLPKFLELVFS